MKVVRTVREVREWRPGAGEVGLVPTMGSLHEGHLSLVRTAREENGAVAASLFVNPTQFGAGEDLARYPRDFDRDRQLLKAEGCDLLFAPPVEEMYPQGFATAIDVGPVAAPLEGARRPGHFKGVATVVLKLFEILRPDRAYFGRKDAQQLAVIRRLVRDLDVPVEVTGCPIVREPDGLALSSRNAFLDPAERRAATVLYHTLLAGRDLWAGGERSGDAIRSAMSRLVAKEPRARADYVSVADPETFQEQSTATPGALLCLAVFVGRTRLIDNMPIGP